MKQKKRINIINILLLVSAILLNCRPWWVHNNVSCKAKMYLCIRNESAKNAIAVFSVAYKNHSDISRFSMDSIIINSNMSAVDTVFYEWSGVDNCYLDCVRSLEWSVFTAAIYMNGNLVFKKDVFPCDSTKQLYITICPDCWHEIYDTLIIH